MAIRKGIPYITDSRVLSLRRLCSACAHAYLFARSAELAESQACRVAKAGPKVEVLFNVTFKDLSSIRIRMAVKSVLAVPVMESEG